MRRCRKYWKRNDEVSYLTRLFEKTFPRVMCYSAGMFFYNYYRLLYNYKSERFHYGEYEYSYYAYGSYIFYNYSEKFFCFESA